MKGGRVAAAAAALLALGAIAPSAAVARSFEPVLHEPIPPDPREDLAMLATIAGQVPAALETRSGVVSAPDPRRPPSPSETPYAKDSFSFAPDRDTRRPEVGAYDDPFTPSTAPFKRLQAFDAVGPDYKLRVADEHLVPVNVNAAAPPSDDVFYASLVVELSSGRTVRIPSVGPAARVVRASLMQGDDELGLRIFRDSADNWSLDAAGARLSGRARLIMEVSAARASFGGPLAAGGWDRLQAVPALPPNVERDAAQVRSVIGVSRALPPREAVGRLVAYFRGFQDSEEPPPARGSVYLDLALSRKGVCRHRAFAFLVTALSLGLPARFVMNETHAWVEVHDGVVWKRIDLGGAGHIAGASASAPEVPAYDPPADAFAWPRGGERGEDAVSEARAGAAASTTPPPSERDDAAKAEPWGDDPGGRVVTLAVEDAQPHRGEPLRLRGEVHAGGAGGQACAHTAVDVYVRDARTSEMTRLGTLATGDTGAFAGSLVVPETLRLGAYDVVARAARGEQCGSR